MSAYLASLPPSLPPHCSKVRFNQRFPHLVISTFLPITFLIHSNPSPAQFTLYTFQPLPPPSSPQPARSLAASPQPISILPITYTTIIPTSLYFLPCLISYYLALIIYQPTPHSVAWYFIHSPLLPPYFKATNSLLPTIPTTLNAHKLLPISTPTWTPCIPPGCCKPQLPYSTPLPLSPLPPSHHYLTSLPSTPSTKHFILPPQLEPLSAVCFHLLFVVRSLKVLSEMTIPLWPWLFSGGPSGDPGEMFQITPSIGLHSDGRPV